MEAKPFAGVTVPLDVEAIAADPVEAGERGVELFAEILREARAVTLNEAIFSAVPFSQYIDGIVELRRPDGGQEAGLQEVVDQLLTGGRHRRFICRGQTARSHLSSWLTCPLGSRRFDMARHWLSPVPWQKLSQPLDSMIVDARQHVGEPSLWIDVIELGGGDEGVDGSRAPAALVRGDAIMPGVWGWRSKSSTHFTLFAGGPRRSSATRFTLIVGTLTSDRKMARRFLSQPG